MASCHFFATFRLLASVRRTATIQGRSCGAQRRDRVTTLKRHIRETLSEVADAAAEAEEFCARAGADEGQRLRVGLALDELAANALTHGVRPGERPDIVIEVWSDEEMLHLRVRARGPRFDPREPRMEAAGPYAMGGRGLAMVLDFADRIDYAWDGSVNETTFSVWKWATETASVVEEGRNEA